MDPTSACKKPESIEAGTGPASDAALFKFAGRKFHLCLVFFFLLHL